jgi:DNA primase
LERTRIEDVVGAVVTLRSAGGGNLKGLCPFHDERTPSFNVTPSKGLYYCFGCGEGGDAIDFVEKTQHVNFVEALEYLADRAGVQLRYVDGGPQTAPGLRSRVLEANKLAAEFFSAGLLSPEGAPAREMLKGRGFDRTIAEQFGVGYAPRGGKALREYLMSKGFTGDELVKAGLVREHGGWDVFQGRVIWPIRDAGHNVLGFGARKLFDDDRMPGKYINTAETVVYKKSSVLYGLDLARGPIAKKNQAVVVEGYTDVMACHLAGIDTAVASCGTAFAEGHAAMLQRLIGAADVRPGEVIFTFDGDRAGIDAALKVYKLDQTFTSQTYVAVEPSGLDPCDLRMQQGDVALRDLIARRQPLYRFVMKHRLEGFDLDRADGRVQALKAVAPLVPDVRDVASLESYVRELSGLIGMDPNMVRREVKALHGKKHGAEREQVAVRPAEKFELPDPKDRNHIAERATASLLLRHPEMFTDEWNGLKESDFMHPAYAAVARHVFALDIPRGGQEWIKAAAKNASPALSALIMELSVEPQPLQPNPAYVDEYAVQVRLRKLSADIQATKSKLQRTNPLEDPDYETRFRSLVDLEAKRRTLMAKYGG